MMRVYFTNLWLPCRQFPNNRQSGNLTRLGNLQSPVEGLAISCSYSAHAPLSVTQEHFLVTTRTQNGPHHQVCGSQVPVTRYRSCGFQVSDYLASQEPCSYGR